MNAEITMGELKRILRTADDDATIGEAVEQLAEARRREIDDLEHVDRMRLYEQYLERRRGRETYRSRGR